MRWARHGLLLRPILAATAMVGHTLHFRTKLGIFHFLVSPEVAELEHLQFCRELVVEVGDPSRPRYGGSWRRPCGRRRSSGRRSGGSGRGGAPSK